MATLEEQAGLEDFPGASNHHDASAPYSARSPNLNSPERLSGGESPDYSALPFTSRLEETNLEGMKSISYWSGVCLVVGEQVGSGIFSTPALVSSNVRNAGMCLVIWIIAGCLTWTGAGTFFSLTI
jgi:hypothetical protein